MERSSIPHGAHVQILGACPPRARILSSVLMRCVTFHSTKTSASAAAMVIGDMWRRMSSSMTAGACRCNSGERVGKKYKQRKESNQDFLSFHSVHESRHIRRSEAWVIYL